jgi:hypothetical protein
VDSIDADATHIKTTYFLTDQERRNISLACNLSTDSTNMFAPATATYGPNLTLSQTFMLPLWANWLNTLQPFVKGFGEDFLVKLYLTKQISTSTSSGVTIGMPVCQLWAQQATMSATAEAELANAHRSGCMYRTIKRQKWTAVVPSLSSTAEYNAPMTQLNLVAAAVGVYVRPNSVTPDDQMTRIPLQYAGLLDAGGDPITQRLPDLLVRSFTAPDSVPFGSYVTQEASGGSFYLFPLCSNLQQVLETGENKGGLQLTGREQVAILAQTTASNVIVTALSWNYGYVRVARGQAVVKNVEYA